MARWAPQRRDTITALADEILHNYGRGRVVVAVDGVAGAGMSTFADDLAEALQSRAHTAFRASMDDFCRPRAERLRRGPDSAEGAYQDSFDYSVFSRVLIEPFRLGGSAAFVTAAFDIARDAQVEPKWITGPDDAILVVDGVYLNRAELAGLWNYSIWVDTPREVAAARVASGYNEPAAVAGQSGAQELYWSQVAPRTRATAIIDNSDCDHPRRVFADSC